MNINLPFANAVLVGILCRILLVGSLRPIKHTPKGKNKIKQGEKPVFFVAKILRWNVVDPIEHPIERRLMYKSQ